MASWRHTASRIATGDNTDAAVTIAASGARRGSPYGAGWWAALLALLIAVTVSLMVGRYPVGFGAMTRMLFGPLVSPDILGVSAGGGIGGAPILLVVAGAPNARVLTAMISVTEYLANPDALLIDDPTTARGFSNEVRVLAVVAELAPAGPP